MARARRRWLREQGMFDPARLVFIDETSANTKMVRLYGRCARGERLVSHVPQGHWKTITFQDPLRRAVQVYQMPGSSSQETVTGPDGKPIAIPPGVDRKTFINEVSKANADAAVGKKTEVQAKDEKFANKMELAEKNISAIEGEGTSYVGRVAEGVPLVGNTLATNWMKSDKYQRYQQARDNFITALLRDESGAAIGSMRACAGLIDERVA